MKVQQSQAKRDAEVAEIIANGKRFDMLDVAEEYIHDGRSASDFNEYVIENIDSKSRSTTVAVPIPGTHRSSPELPHGQQYSLARVVQSLALERGLDGLEAETGQELERLGRADGTYRGEGVCIPFHAFAPPQTQQRALMTVSSAASAGNLVGEDHMAGDFVSILRNKSAVFELGARVLSGLTGTVSIPRQVSATSAEWLATEGTAATESDVQIDQLNLTPHDLSANVSYSRRLMLQSAPAIEQLVRDDLREQLSLAIDLAALSGSGSSGQPLGITGTTGIGSVSFGTPNGGAPTWSTILALAADIETANAAEGALGYLTNFNGKKKLMDTERVSGFPTYILPDTPGDRMAGYPIAFSNQVASDGVEGSGTNLSSIFFGNWNDLLVGVWGNFVEVIVDPFTLSTQGRVRVSAWSHVDTAVRHPESFSLAADMITT